MLGEQILELNPMKHSEKDVKVARTVKTPNIKEKMTEVIQAQPADAAYEEIMRELAFERMIERGLADSRNDRVVSNEEMERRISTWQK